MTQKELADAVGMPRYGDRTIRRWENGETTPSILELKQILEFPEKTPFPNNDQARFTMIDLFAGIGGTRLGFHLTGLTKVVFSSEIDKYSIKTYGETNFGDKPKGNICDIPSENIPDHDILVAGFPCQSILPSRKKLGLKIQEERFSLK